MRFQEGKCGSQAQNLRPERLADAVLALATWIVTGSWPCAKADFNIPLEAEAPRTKALSRGPLQSIAALGRQVRAMLHGRRPLKAGILTPKGLAATPGDLSTHGGALT